MWRKRQTRKIRLEVWRLKEVERGLQNEWRKDESIGRKWMGPIGERLTRNEKK
jgi:hypothetical protein